MRRPMSHPCSGPMVSRVRSTIRASDPCSTSVFSSFMRLLVGRLQENRTPLVGSQQEADGHSSRNGKCTIPAAQVLKTENAKMNDPAWGVGLSFCDFGFQDLSCRNRAISISPSVGPNDV